MLSACLVASLALLGPIPKDLCTVPMAKSMAVGHYQGRFFQLGNAQGGQAQMNLKVQFQFKGSIEFDVSDDGTVKNAKSEAKFTIYAAGMPKNLILGGFSGSGTGTLTHGTGGKDRFSVSGDLAGTGGAFVRTKVNDQEGMARHQGSTSGSTTVQFTVSVTSCRHSSGTFTASIFDDTVSSLSGKGFRVTKGTAGWSVKQSDVYDRRKAEVERELKQAEGLLRGGGEDAHGAQAFPRYIKTGQKILSEHSEALRYCLAEIFRTAFAQAVGAQVDRKLQKLAGTPADPRNLHPIRLEVGPLVKISNAIVDCKMDLCSATIHQKIFSGILSKLKEVVDRAARQRYVLPDVVHVLMSEKVTGVVAPAQRAAAVSELKAYIAKVKRDGPPRP